MIGKILRGLKGDAHRSAPDRRGPNHYFSLQDPYGDRWDDDDPDYTDYDAGNAFAPAAPPAARKRTRWWWFSRAVAAFLFLLMLMAAWLAITAPLSKSLEPIAPPQITLLSANGTPIARNGAIIAAPVDTEKLPDHVVDAFLAIEDRRFFTHWGVDPRGLARAALSNVTGGSTQGGSTITQQLAKFTFLTPERSMTRKAREMLIAFWLEAWLTKDEILERYLSNTYFGDNVYGLRAASLHYFYRQPENLTLGQAAMLAGLVQAPSRFAPTRHYDRAEKRMKMVVNAMVAGKFITDAEARTIRRPGLDVRTRNTLPTGTYFADWALPEARKMAGANYSSQTYTTTLDARLQGIASGVINRAGLGGAQVALVAMRPNGDVVAMIGGKDYRKSPFNRATQAKRQPGSTFKLFVWLTALDAGMNPDDLIDNRAFEKGSYQPRNASGRYSQSITLKDAFARSSNVAAVRLFNQLGDKAIIRTARDFGIRSPLAEGDPSLALGTSTVTLLELTAAYAGVAANEFPVIPRAFPAEEKGWFDWMWNSKSSLSSSEHKAMQGMLRSVINSGTGRAAMLTIPNYGKTGTSQDNRDALFIGYAGDLVVGVWIGNDDNTPLAGVSGGGLPAKIWANFMRQAQNVPVRRQNRGNVDPAGPIQPLDVPDVGDIPIGDNGTRLKIEDGTGLTISTDINGMPVDIRLDDRGVRVEPVPPPPPPPPEF
ncbi:penicillin-binding protein [Altererythrobacter confluentis]|uniref:Penicillin-binding protein n=1 Tax=Allopontixanthobacter confluentis TaxID=1849021 RepID=A0A6L7GDY0_9SPHN|nr:transglycosylase domain-containing protein [Allopontixanthobacter confluentis]MXP13695.1 penicillin-binding protein [Allopontixanthobacter confluentis]